MEKVYICGHKNPDTDSIAAATTYAYLKNKVDGMFDYTPVRTGSASEQTKFIFQRAGATLPDFLKDIYPKVSENMSSNVISVFEHDPISKILKHIRENSIRFTPVVDSDNNYKGMAGVHELSELFIRDDRGTKPTFHLRSDTLQRSLKASVINKGEVKEFEASIVVANMAYESFQKHISEVSDVDKTILVIGNRQNIIDDVLKMNFPVIVIVGLADDEIKSFDKRDFKGWIYASPFDTAQTIRCIEMATPVNRLMTTAEAVEKHDYLDSISDRISQSSTKSLPVVEDGKLIGIITGTDILKKKRSKLILVDHNELTQAIDGAETAEIVEIIDHHRLGTIKTNNPIYFYAKPVGSTCTLVYQLYKLHGVELPRDMGILLLGGMLSDTVILKSPTTTYEDIQAIKELSETLNIDFQEFGVEIFSATDSLTARTVSDIIGTDFKIFDENGVKFGISQVETVTLKELDTIKDSLIAELKNLSNMNNLQWNMIMVTDIIKEESILITTSFVPAEKLLKYRPIDETSFFLPGVLSRKKQLLPEILRTLEELASN